MCTNFGGPRAYGLWLLLLLALACQETQPTFLNDNVGVVQAGLERALQQDGSVNVIVSLREPAAAYSSSDREARARTIAALHDDVLARVGSDVKALWRYKHTPAFSATVSRAGLERLQRDPAVRYVQRDNQGHVQMERAIAAAKVDQVRAMFDLTGRGVHVATLDSGVATMHPDLQGAVIAQHCFTQLGCAPLLANESDTAEDDHGHGTGVAGIIASRGMVTTQGFAPGVDLISVKVVRADGVGVESDWVKGLDWLFDNLPRLRVDIVNLSVTTNDVYTPEDCDLRHPALVTAIGNLVQAGVIVLAAAGNVASRTSMSAPACVTGALAVGASYADGDGAQPPGVDTYRERAGGNMSFADCRDDETKLDQVACFSNRNRRTDLVAPGIAMVTDGLDGKMATWWGTSMATAAASGVAALLLECAPFIDRAEIKPRLLDTGRPASDPFGEVTLPAIDALAAVRAACDNLVRTATDAGAPDAGQVVDAGATAQTPPPGAGSMSTAGAVAADAGAAPSGAGSQASGVQPSTTAGAQAVSGTEDGGSAGHGTIEFPDTITKRGSLPAMEKKSSGCGVVTLGARRTPPLGAAFPLLLMLWRLRRSRRPGDDRHL